MNAHPRWSGLIAGLPGLDWNLSAGASADGGHDRSMNRPLPRRGRATGRPGRARRTPPTTPDRLQEGTRVNAPNESDVRQDLVSRVREEIRDGTYDTPEKLEAALDRLADRLGGE